MSAVLGLASLPLSAAAPPLALRVDIVPTSISSDGTTTTVEVQLAPPDRGRIGRQARMRVKLIQGSKIRAHILQDIDFDSQGLATAEYTWEPGRYELSLEIESLQGTAKGLWIGQIEIPANLDHAAEPAIPLIEVADAQPIVEAKPAPPQAGATAGAAAGVAPAVPQVESQVPAAAPETLSPDPMPSRAGEPLQTAAPEAPGAVAAAQPPTPTPPSVKEPLPQANETVPPLQSSTASEPSGPVFGLVIDIDGSNTVMIDRAAGIRAEIEDRAKSIPAIVVRSEEPDPTHGINRALDTMTSYADARAIVVVTDGRRKASGSAWKRLTARATDAGLPIIVVGLWNNDFNPGTRKQLSRLASESGGSSYLLQPSESPDRALETLESTLFANQ